MAGHLERCQQSPGRPALTSSYAVCLGTTQVLPTPQPCAAWIEPGCNAGPEVRA